MKSLYDIIVRPVITEKSMLEKSKGNYVTFQVPLKVSKQKIKRAVESIFEVTVEDIKTMRVRGKQKRLGKFSGRRPDWKKALVKLKSGDTIEQFEGLS